jgi:hypothetical protein
MLEILTSVSLAQQVVDPTVMKQDVGSDCKCSLSCDSPDWYARGGMESKLSTQ